MPSKLVEVGDEMVLTETSVAGDGIGDNGRLMTRILANKNWRSLSSTSLTRLSNLYSRRGSGIKAQVVMKMGVNNEKVC